MINPSNNNYSLKHDFIELSFNEKKELESKVVEVEIDEDYLDYEKRVSNQPASKQAVKTIQDLGEWEKESKEYHAAQANGSIGSEHTIRTINDQQEWNEIQQETIGQKKESRLDDLEEEWDAYYQAKNTETPGLVSSLFGYFTGS